MSIALLLSFSVAGEIIPVFADDGETAWKLYDRNTSRPVARLAAQPHRLACGAYGVFEMDFSGAEGFDETTGSREEGREVPPRYPLLGTSLSHAPLPSGVARSTSATDVGTQEPSGGIARLGAAARPLPGPTAPPCVEGSCFSPPGSEPWVAVVDWDDWHGWSIGQTILQASGHDLQVALFPLNDPYLAAEFGDRVTDVHVLHQLCRIAEEMTDPAVSPPVAVNMSFGRLALPTDPVNGGCDGSTLACQIVRVLEHLAGTGPYALDGVAAARDEPVRPLLVGAAGNHRELLFPASAAPVVATGSLDLPVFKGKGRPYPAWETPDGIQALFPGHGICLEYDLDRKTRASWPAPPGSSYAAAMMTGWVAPSLLTGKVKASAVHFWAPVAACRGKRCSLQVTVSGRPLPLGNSAAQTMMGRALSNKSSCGDNPGEGIEAVRSLGAPQPLSALPRLSFPAISPSLQRPTPEPSTCVPCEDRFRKGVGRSLAPVDSVQEASGNGKGHGGGSQGEVLSLDLWAAQSLDPDLTLESLHLRLGEELLPVLLERGDLAALTAGDLAILTLDLGARRLDPSFQPSLVWVLRGPTEAGEASFWTSTPILLRR